MAEACNTNGNDKECIHTFGLRPMRIWQIKTTVRLRIGSIRIMTGTNGELLQIRQ
jgi:hypothetical protein